MRYFLIAGEASGDLHASMLIEQLRKKDANAEFAFLGGDMMQKASGQAPLVHYRDMAYMGFMEVARHFRAIMRNFKVARNAIKDFHPDRLILIDYPSFNLKMAKYAKELGIEVVYYIPPKVWAWKQWRVKTIKKVVDKVLAIFPFEVDFYDKHGVKALYVGNPSVGEIDERIKQVKPREEFLKSHRLPDKAVLALLPGSRMAELRSNLPIMAAVAQRFPQYRAVIAGAPGIEESTYREILGDDGSNPYKSLPIVFGETYDLLAHSHVALVTSGTATLETALVGVPQVAMYRHNGSKLMRKMKEKFLNVKFVTLPNLIADGEIIPEMLLDQCTAESVSERLSQLTPDKEARQKMLADYADMRARLGDGNAAATAAAQI